ncbi:hypothetical protein SOVF_147440 [Spinacia oleracea]|nr:hypothetical protein SOVF_147440 [Spinacia oleracea]
MEDFERKVTISEEMETGNPNIKSFGEDSRSSILILLRKFLSIQQRRAEAYAKLRDGFGMYMISGKESTYQQLCSEITEEFSDCSKQVREMESQFLKPDCFRDDLARLLRAVQELEKLKLHLTLIMQVLKKAGRPSERLVTHENCRFKKAMHHECVHVQELTDAAGTEEAEADAEYDNAVKEAIVGVQEAVISINEHLEEVRYEIAALESD